MSGKKGPPAALPVSPEKTVETVVGLLDELVAMVVKKHVGKVNPDFLDWVADEMTPRLECLALVRFGDERHNLMAATEARQWVLKTCLPALEQRIQVADKKFGEGMRVDIVLDRLKPAPKASPQKNA